MKKAILYLIVFTSILGCSSDKSISQNDRLFGEWKLMKFISSDGTVLTANDFENSKDITIEFNTDFNYMGETGYNDFFGSYSLNMGKDTKDTLILKKVHRSEANESGWGSLFFDKLRLNYDPSTQYTILFYQVRPTELRIFYSEDDYMYLEKR
ncbi:hypothetical protein [Aequorivita marina]|uniref:hypothetical protein n=1 Tax=Aequorivita marina TaxID=3073654 RepID=UPI00287521D2|nr:hypothetical protein [Aequorivita sp. S2608]MDS1299761.1 hypothetical protein [Aequorivita sp. S2608]